jgi:hypothetical protein
MAKRVLSIRRFRSLAAMSNLWLSSPAARSGKSSGGSVCRAKRECPELSVRRSFSTSRLISTSAPSGSLRTMSCRMWRARRRTGLRYVGRRFLLHLALEVGGLELQALPEALSSTFDRWESLCAARPRSSRDRVPASTHRAQSPASFACLDGCVISATCTAHAALRIAIVRQTEKPRIGLGDSQAWSRVDRDALLCKGWAAPPPSFSHRRATDVPKRCAGAAPD